MPSVQSTTRHKFNHRARQRKEFIEEELGSSPDLDDWSEAISDECRGDCTEPGMIEFLEESEDIDELFEDCDDTSISGCPPAYSEACSNDLIDCATVCEGNSICVQDCCYDFCYCLQAGECEGVQECFSSCDDLPTSHARY